MSITLSKRIYTSEYYVPSAEYTLVLLLYSRDTKPYAEPTPYYDLLTRANSTRSVFLSCADELYVDPDVQAKKERERALKIALPVVIVPVFLLVFGTTLGQWMFWRRWRLVALLLWPAIWWATRRERSRGGGAAGEKTFDQSKRKADEEMLPTLGAKQIYKSPAGESKLEKARSEDLTKDMTCWKSEKKDKAPLPPAYAESEPTVGREGGQALSAGSSSDNRGAASSGGGGGLLAMLADPELAQRLEERDEEEQAQHRQRSRPRGNLSRLADRGPALLLSLREKDQVSLRKLSESRLRRWFWWRIDKFAGSGKRDWEGWRRRLGEEEKWRV